MSSETHHLNSGQQYPLYNSSVDTPATPGQAGVTTSGHPIQSNPLQSSLPDYYMVSAIMPVLAPMGKQPQIITCWFCQRVVETRIEYRPGPFAWCSCSLLCCLGCICGCCLIPFFWKPCQDVYHFCSYCSSPLGIYSRI